MKLKTGRDWASVSPYGRFFDFIAPDADRFGILRSHLQELGLNSIVLAVEGNRHFFIFPQGMDLRLSAGSKFPFSGQSPVILTAHYDRVSGSPGANDNSAAVFQLIRAALKLGEQRLGYWIIIFTDKEELQKGEGIGEQGSFSLAKKLRRWGLGSSRIFNFDACGTGDTLVFSSTADYLLNKNTRPGLRRTGMIVNSLREKALGAAGQLGMSKVLLMPTPFSDDAGFLSGGIPAQTITMLPGEEAVPFATLLRKRPAFADLLISGSINNPAARRLIPETWRCLNGPSDSHLRLTPVYFEKIVCFAVELCSG